MSQLTDTSSYDNWTLASAYQNEDLLSSPLNQVSSQCTSASSKCNLSSEPKQISDIYFFPRIKLSHHSRLLLSNKNELEQMLTDSVRWVFWIL